jgi:hypothetical protein
MFHIAVVVHSGGRLEVGVFPRQFRVRADIWNPISNERDRQHGFLDEEGAVLSMPADIAASGGTPAPIGERTGPQEAEVARAGVRT